MSNLIIKKAERKQAKIKMGFSGPSGSGKTMSALKVACGLVGGWDEICVIDTENNSADLYAHLGGFSTMTLEKPYSPERFIEAIALAEKSGFKCIIIDSISHEWEGPGGILDIVDAMGGKMWHWKDVTPRHQKLVNAILSSKAHIISTLRTKSDYAISKDDKNKTVVEKVGLKPVTKEGFDYELTVSFDLDINNHARASKDRTNLFMKQAPFIPSESTGEKIQEWCDSGSLQIEQPKEAEPAPVHADTLTGKPENKAAQAEFERKKIADVEKEKIAKNKKRWDALKKDIRDGFGWTKDSVDTIISVLDENHDDPELIRAYLTGKGWRGTADLSDVAAQGMAAAG